MAKQLFPLGYESEIVRADDLIKQEKIGYKPGLLFDLELGDFLREGKNRIQRANGVQSWAGWCQNCLMTERYQHLAYSTDFGIETEEAFRAENRSKAESLLTRQINEALRADPYGRTDYVERITFVWSGPDTVQVTVTVHGLDNRTIDLTANITR